MEPLSSRAFFLFLIIGATITFAAAQTITFAAAVSRNSPSPSYIITNNNNMVYVRAKFD